MFNPSFSAQALVAMKLIYSCCVEHGASSCALAKLSVRKMSSLPTFRPLADAFSSQHRKLRGSDNSPATAGAVGAHERGAQADPPHKNARSKQRTSPSACARLRSLVAALACSGDWNMVPNRPGTCERLEKPRERDRRGGHAYSPG